MRWFAYQPKTTTTVVVRGDVYAIFGRDRYAHPGGVAILTSSLGVIDCAVVDGGGNVPAPNQTVAVAGPAKITANTLVYIVQFARDTYNGPCSEVVGCDSSEENLTVRSVGDYPVNDDWSNATPVTQSPFSQTVDTTLSTQQDLDRSVFICGGTNVSATRTVWWTVTPTTTGPLDASVAADSTSGYRLGYAEVTADGIKPLNTNCLDSPSLTAGHTYLVAVGIPEYNRSDEAVSGEKITFKVTGAPKLGKPDLVVTKVVSSPAAPKAGDPVSFKATIKNQGTAPTPGGVVHGVLFTIDGAPKTWSDTFNASLAPGQSVTLTTNGGKAGAATWPATAGNHTVLATVDDINRIPGEANESNNSRSLPLTIATGPARPDLVVTGVSWTPTSPGSGAAVTFKATIKNQGSAATPAGVVHGVLFNVDGEPKTWSDTSTAALAPGASRTVTANWGKAGKATWPATTGPHTVQAVVDDINRIKTESDETNNALAVPLNIGTTVSRPDLIVTGVSWSPTSPAAGAKTRFTATVKNIGTRSTPGGTKVGVSFRPNGQTTGATYSDTWTTPVHPGQTVTLTANGGATSGTWTTPAGTTPITAIVDDINRIPETNEANNTLNTTITTG